MKYIRKQNNGMEGHIKAILIYLKLECGFIQNVYSEKLSDDLINLTRNLTNKRNKYFTAAQNIPLENINYRNLYVFSPNDTDNLLHQISNDSDNKSQDILNHEKQKGKMSLMC